jgi:hypothetical protein
MGLFLKKATKIPRKQNFRLSPRESSASPYSFKKGYKNGHAERVLHGAEIRATVFTKGVFSEKCADLSRASAALIQFRKRPPSQSP